MLVRCEQCERIFSLSLSLLFVACSLVPSIYKIYHSSVIWAKTVKQKIQRGKQERKAKWHGERWIFNVFYPRCRFLRLHRHCTKSNKSFKHFIELFIRIYSCSHIYHMTFSPNSTCHAFCLSTEKFKNSKAWQGVTLITSHLHMWFVHRHKETCERVP